MAHAEPFAFEDGPIRYSGDAFRFLNGTPNVPALYSARSGYEIINEIGVPAIREKSVRQTTRLIALADEAGLRVNTPRDPERRGGVVILDVENGKVVTRELARREVLVDYRPGAGVRVAPHFYTTDEELEHTVEEVRQVASLYRPAEARIVQ
jgi:kynureninase